jgi:serine O-acetyltransferase
MLTRIQEDIRNIISRDPAARNTWEVLTCYPGLHAIILHRITHYLWNHHLKWLARFLSYLGKIITSIEIHPAAHIGRRVFIDHGFGVVIGETAHVGDDCTIYQSVTLGGTSLTRGTKRHPTLESNIIVGAGAKVLGNIIIGQGAKIGSNAVVTKDVAAHTTMVGNPARAATKSSDAFTAYAVTQNSDDALTKTLHSLINHAALQEKQIQALREALQNANIACQFTKEKDDFDPNQLNKLVD